MGIGAHVDHSAFGPLATSHDNRPPAQIQIIDSEGRRLFHPQSATEHEVENGSISRIVYDLEELSDLLISKKPRQRLGQPEQVAALYGVFHLDLLFFFQVPVERPDAVEIAVDGLRAQPPIQQGIDEREKFLAIHLFNGAIEPEDELLERAEVVPDGIPGVVLPLERAPKAYDRIGNCHGSPPSRSRPSP